MDVLVALFSTRQYNCFIVVKHTKGNKMSNEMIQIMVDYQLHGSTNVDRKFFMSQTGYNRWFDAMQHRLSYCKVS